MMKTRIVVALRTTLSFKDVAVLGKGALMESEFG